MNIQIALLPSKKRFNEKLQLDTFLLHLYHFVIAWRLERLPTVPKITVRGSPRVNDWTFAHCPINSEWGPDGNTGEIKAVKKGTGHPTS